MKVHDAVVYSCDGITLACQWPALRERQSYLGSTCMSVVMLLEELPREQISAGSENRGFRFVSDCLNFDPGFWSCCLRNCQGNRLLQAENIEVSGMFLIDLISSCLIRFSDMRDQTCWLAKACHLLISWHEGAQCSCVFL